MEKSRSCNGKRFLNNCRLILVYDTACLIPPTHISHDFPRIPHFRNLLFTCITVVELSKYQNTCFQAKWHFCACICKSVVLSHVLCVYCVVKSGHFDVLIPPISICSLLTRLVIYDWYRYDRFRIPVVHCYFRKGHATYSLKFWMKLIPVNYRSTKFCVWFNFVNFAIFAKADPRLTQDIAYIYEILHCNHFIILSNATAHETTTIVVVSYAVALLRSGCSWGFHRHRQYPG